MSKSSNSSPLRGQTELHSSSFSYGNAAAVVIQGNQGSQGNGYAHRGGHSGALTMDHDAGPGRANTDSELYNSSNSRGGYRPITPQSPNPHGLSSPGGNYSSPNSTASAGRRSISTSRYSTAGSPGYGQQQQQGGAGSAGGAGVGAGGASKVEFYDGGRNVTPGGSGSPDRDGNRLRLSAHGSPQQTSDRPGTSGGVRHGTTSPHGTSNGGYAIQQAGSPYAYASKPSGQQQLQGTAGLRLQDYAYESNGSGGAYANGSALTLNRPRTSGGMLPSSGQGRSASSGRAGSSKRRF